MLGEAWFFPWLLVISKALNCYVMDEMFAKLLMDNNVAFVCGCNAALIIQLVSKLIWYTLNLPKS